MMALFTYFQHAYSASTKAGWSFIDGYTWPSWLPTRRWNRY